MKRTTIDVSDRNRMSKKNLRKFARIYSRYITNKKQVSIDGEVFSKVRNNGRMMYEYFCPEFIMASSTHINGDLVNPSEVYCDGAMISSDDMAVSKGFVNPFDAYKIFERRLPASEIRKFLTNQFA